MSEQTEFARKTAKAVAETQRQNRLGWLQFLPLAVALAGIIGASYVGEYRLEAAETTLERKADQKDVDAAIDKVRINVEHMEKEFNSELGHVKEDVAEIQESIDQIQAEQKETNKGITKILIKLGVPPE